MLAVARTFALIGVDAVRVDAEIDIHRGLPAFSVVGLPDAAVREARERVRAAIVNSGFEFPLKRITVSLAPSDLRKAGPGFDLAIAAAILVASGQLPESLLERWSLAGELGLDGALRPVRGGLAMAEQARDSTGHGLLVPAANAPECCLVSDLELGALNSLGDLRALAADGELPELPETTPLSPGAAPADLADLRGQPSLRRALEVAAAGGHSLLMIGPPGAGKSLAARRLPSILPPLGESELIEVTRILGAAGLGNGRALGLGRPFRAPHHTISPAGLVGGGSPPRPGEITLAHRGVLFLDELPEFSRMSLEAMRQPLEAGEVTIARAQGALRFPARFQLIAAANPCPCGHGEDSEACSCLPDQCRRYIARLSGALADRIDLVVRVEQPSAAALAGAEPEGSEVVRERVLAARALQVDRYEGSGAVANAEIDERTLRRRTALDSAGRRALEQAQERARLSGRGWTRVLRTARTIADLSGCERLDADHVAEALSLRTGSA